MLDGLRSHASSFGAKLLLAFLILTFAIWGVGDILRRPNQNITVASVGDKVITMSEFQSALKRDTDNVRRALGDRYSPDVLKSLRISDRVLQRLVENDLVALESESLGLLPSDADVVRRIRANPAFADNQNNFDKHLFEATLRNSGQSEKTYIDKMRQEMASTLVMESLSATLPIPQPAVRTLYEARAEQRTAALYLITLSEAGSIPAPTDAQLQDYYTQHVQEFSAPEYRTLSYVSFRSDDVHASATVPDAELQAAYKERLDEFRKPELRNVDQLLYADEDQAKKAYALLQGGTAFDQVAKTTPILNKTAIALGNVDRGHIVEAAEDAVFSAKEGGITAPIQSPFGWHIFRINHISAPSVATLAEARPTLEKDLKQHDTDEAINKLANTLEDTLAGGSTLQEAATTLGLKVHSVGPLDHQGMSPSGVAVQGIPDFDKFMELAFKTDEKSESSLTMTKGGVYYIVRVDSITPERARALSEVKSLVVAGWQKQQRAAKLAEFANDVAKKLAKKETRDAVVSEYKLKTVTTGPLKRTALGSNDIPLPAAFVAELFTLKPGETTQAYASKDGNYVIGAVRDIVPATPDANKQDKLHGDIQQELSNNMRNEILSQYLRYLAKKFPVNINESLLESSEQDSEPNAAQR